MMRKKITTTLVVRIDISFCTCFHSLFFSVLLTDSPINSTQNENDATATANSHHNLELSRIPGPSTSTAGVLDHEDTVAAGHGAGLPHVCHCGKDCTRYE